MNRRAYVAQHLAIGATARTQPCSTATTRVVKGRCSRYVGRARDATFAVVFCHRDDNRPFAWSDQRVARHARPRHPTNPARRLTRCETSGRLWLRTSIGAVDMSGSPEVIVDARAHGDLRASTPTSLGAWVSRELAPSGARR